MVGIERLTPAQAVVALAWAALGRIGNGGFRHHFECDWRMARAADAFRTLGFADAAAACERSLDAFPGRRPPEDVGRRRELLGGIDWAPFGEDEDRVYGTATFEDLERAILAHMARHPEEFAEFR